MKTWITFGMKVQQMKMCQCYSAIIEHSYQCSNGSWHRKELLCCASIEYRSLSCYYLCWSSWTGNWCLAFWNTNPLYYYAKAPQQTEWAFRKFWCPKDMCFQLYPRTEPTGILMMSSVQMKTMEVFPVQKRRGFTSIQFNIIHVILESPSVYSSLLTSWISMLLSTYIYHLTNLNTFGMT